MGKKCFTNTIYRDVYGSSNSRRIIRKLSLKVKQNSKNEARSDELPAHGAAGTGDGWKCFGVRLVSDSAPAAASLIP
jgi:hypothetical protein